MAKVARAMAYAHSKGVLHRDLQPGNILLDENGEPMVSDFGLAKWLDQGSDLTRTLETLGTPGYIPPEQAERPADKLTCAADVYSLGAILFYLLTGRPPFVGLECSSCYSSGCCDSGTTFAFTGTVARPRSGDNRRLVVSRAIRTRAINPPERWQMILNIGCGTSRFGRGALEFSLADENGCDGIQLLRCW